MKSNKLLGGSPPDYIVMNILLYGHADPDMPNLPPDVIADMLEQAKPKFSKPIGKPIIVGTAGDIGKSAFFELFKNNEK